MRRTFWQTQKIFHVHSCHLFNVKKKNFSHSSRVSVYLGETKLVEKFSLQLFFVQLIKLNGTLNRRLLFRFSSLLRFLLVLPVMVLLFLLF